VDHSDILLIMNLFDSVRRLEQSPRLRLRLQPHPALAAEAGAPGGAGKVPHQPPVDDETDSHAATAAKKEPAAQDTDSAQQRADELEVQAGEPSASDVPPPAVPPSESGVSESVASERPDEGEQIQAGETGAPDVPPPAIPPSESWVSESGVLGDWGGDSSPMQAAPMQHLPQSYKVTSVIVPPAETKTVSSTIHSLDDIPFRRVRLPQLPPVTEVEAITWYDKRSSNIEAGMVLETGGVEWIQNPAKVIEAERKRRERR